MMISPCSLCALWLFIHTKAAVSYRTSVMKIDQRENLIRRYLIGELAEADQAALERELLINRGKFDQVWAVENELVDSYVRGEMSRADRNRFERRYMASPLHRERVAIAESFLTNIDKAVGEAVGVREKESRGGKSSGVGPANSG
jgi:hypothetical protein